jgi:predicted transcriptional regulator
MVELWTHQGGTVHEVTSSLNPRLPRPLSTKTILTCLTRLEAKGLVAHTKEGRAYRFAPTMTQEQLVIRHVAEEVDKLIDRWGPVAVTVFAERIDHDIDLQRQFKGLLEAGHEGGHS